MNAPPSATVPIVSATSVPASVRDGSPAARKAYETALDFEQMLVGQLSKGLIESSGLSGEGEGAGGVSGEEGASGQAGSAGAGLLSALAPQALTEAIIRDGGLGLAGQLLRALDPAAATEGPQTTAATSGGAAPSAASSPGSGAGGPGSATGDRTAGAVGANGGASA